jgi:putative transposase
MARSPRLDSRAWHHVMHRGARREAIFGATPNHYHLLVRTPLGNLSRCMRHVNATYTQRVNRRHGWDGPVFRGRFHSQLIEDERYLDHVVT